MMNTSWKKMSEINVYIFKTSSSSLIFKIISLTESGYIKNEKKYILVKSDSKKERLIMEIDVIDKDVGKLTYGKHLLIEKI